jgi:hypothetical protein
MSCLPLLSRPERTNAPCTVVRVKRQRRANATPAGRRLHRVVASLVPTFDCNWRWIPDSRCAAPGMTGLRICGART